jgi:hypothetical protein
VPEEEFHAWLDGALSTAQGAEIAEHLLGCLICRAAHAEAVAVRNRSAAILGSAIPVGQRRSLPGLRPAAPSRRQRVGVAAAAAVLVGLGWMANQPDVLALPAPRLSTMAFVSPAIHARVGDLELALGADQSRARRIPLLAGSTLHPRMITPASNRPGTPRRLALAPAADVDPAISWESISWEAALEAGGGSLARLEGLPVTAVRIQRNGDGVRPTFFVKQRLPDGHAVWVVEGPEDRVAPVHLAIEASGLASSFALRTRPDYVGGEDAPTRTMRLVTVAAAMEKDAVDGLVGRLRLE